MYIIYSIAERRNKIEVIQTNLRKTDSCRSILRLRINKHRTKPKITRALGKTPLTKSDIEKTTPQPNMKNKESLLLFLVIMEGRINNPQMHSSTMTMNFGIAPKLYTEKLAIVE